MGMCLHLFQKQGAVIDFGQFEIYVST